MKRKTKILTLLFTCLTAITSSLFLTTKKIDNVKAEYILSDYEGKEVLIEPDLSLIQKSDTTYYYKFVNDTNHGSITSVNGTFLFGNTIYNYFTIWQLNDSANSLYAKIQLTYIDSSTETTLNSLTIFQVRTTQGVNNVEINLLQNPLRIQSVEDSEIYFLNFLNNNSLIVSGEIDYAYLLETIDNLNDKVSELNNNVNELTLENNTLSNNVITANNQITSLNNQITTLTSNLNTANSTITQKETYIQELQDALDFGTGSTGTEIVNIPGLMLNILTLPFTFISQAFDVTIFEDTPYQINFADLFKGMIGLLTLLFIIKLLTNGTTALGNISANENLKAERRQDNARIRKNSEIANNGEKRIDKK